MYIFFFVSYFFHQVQCFLIVKTHFVCTRISTSSFTISSNSTTKKYNSLRQKKTKKTSNFIDLKIFVRTVGTCTNMNKILFFLFRLNKR